MSNYSVSLVGPAPWGFRLQGGKDFNMPLTISKLTDGGKAARANVGIGDVVLTIDGIGADGMTHLEAQNKIKACTGSLNLTLQKVLTTLTSQSIPAQKEEPREVVKPVPISSAPAVPKVASTTSVAYNKAPRPFGAAPSPKATSIPSASSAFSPASTAFPSRASPPPNALSVLAALTPTPPASPGMRASPKPSSDGYLPTPSAAKATVNVPWQPTAYGTAANLHSTEHAQEVAEAQRRGFAENQSDSKQQNGKIPPKRPPRKHIVDTYTEFYHTPTLSDASKKRLIDNTEDWHPRTGTSQSRSFRILAQITGTERMAEPEQEELKKPKLSSPFIYRSLLDALLVTPISKPPLQYKLPTRNSTGGLNVEKNSDILEPAQPSAYAAAASKSMPMGPEGRSRPSATHQATTFKPTSSPSAAKSAGWQPGVPAAPVTGRIFNSNTLSGAKVPSSNPVPLPSLNKQDTLVQKAEHIPAGTRTPMCAKCNLVIRGPFLLALGKSWHPEEFNCAHCKISMAETGFVEERGAFYCEVCYEKFFAPECARCQRKIIGEVINALKQTWHVACFVCVACHKPIRNNVFHLEDGDPYCEMDYYSLFGTMCHGCEFPIEAGDRFLEALGATWHDTCFVCAVCCESLEGQTFFSKKDKPLCKKHAHAVNI
ncbi:PDZ and LIM domain protein 5 isoform X11 [Rhinatrema bivittatum]|uniref:PDZ and LIM domain protein 5 isoform X11 n=1 Tax=Rhinatrema bivittatum TaxID=194408 RepID=UPI0011280BED|nr:PDZ and LIM domain protein 5 isoform X11 [Rhinatrema bivittatum]